jgi:hypothetical protein
MSAAEWVADVHGFLTTLSFLGYGAVIACIGLLCKYRQENLRRPLTWSLGIQTLIVGATSALGIVAYVAYRTPGGAREFLLNNPQTSWLHNTAFEYMENLCGITPWLLLMVCFFVAITLGSRLAQHGPALRFIFGGSILSLIFVLISAVMAVFVSKVAPLQKFSVGGDLFSGGGYLVLGLALLTVIIVGGVFWLITLRFRQKQSTNGDASIGPIMYGSAVGLTLMWTLNWAKVADTHLSQSLNYINSIGPYAGVLIWTLVTIVIAALVAWLVTARTAKGSLSLTKAGWTLLMCALVQIPVFFEPFYQLFIK